MKIKPSLFFLVVVAFISACNGFDPQEYVPGLYTSTPVLSQVEITPSSIPLISIAMSSTPEMISLTTVCTNTPGGKLNVRFSPGENSEVRGYLIENEKVTTSGEREELMEPFGSNFPTPLKDGSIHIIYVRMAMNRNRAIPNNREEAWQKTS